MNTEPTFPITLADLKTLSIAVCELDACKSFGDARLTELVTDCHDILIRTLGDQVGLVYAPDDGSEAVEAKAAA